MTTADRIKAINASPYYRSPYNTFAILSKAAEKDLITVERFIAAEAKKAAAPPDGYAEALSKRPGSRYIAAGDEMPATSDVYSNPPDGYQIALDKRQRAAQ